MLHLQKLCVGIGDIPGLSLVQSRRRAKEGRLCHLTRQTPKRAAEIVDGGSLYWAILGVLQARQRIIGIEAASKADGSACAALVLDPVLIPVLPRAVRPFQGWRYLASAEAPADLPPQAAGQDLPPGLAKALRELALI